MFPIEKRKGEDGDGKGEKSEACSADGGRVSRLDVITRTS